MERSLWGHRTCLCDILLSVFMLSVLHYLPVVFFCLFVVVFFGGGLREVLHVGTQTLKLGFFLF